jgi:hypothetical protein
MSQEPSPRDRLAAEMERRVAEARASLRPAPTIEALEEIGRRREVRRTRGLWLVMLLAGWWFFTLLLFITFVGASLVFPDLQEQFDNDALLLWCTVIFFLTCPAAGLAASVAGVWYASALRWRWVTLSLLTIPVTLVVFAALVVIANAMA